MVRRSRYLKSRPNANVKGASDLSDSIYGGYANGRGEIVLFGKDLAYRVDLKKQTLQLRPRLNFGAQARYDATDAGGAFSFGNKTFQRLSEQQITEVCGFGCFLKGYRSAVAFLAGGVGRARTDRVNASHVHGLV